MLIILAVICSISCEKDLVQKENNVAIEQINIENGRISFPDKSTFLEFYNNSKDKEIDQIASMMDDQFYKNNFYSLKPIVNNETEKEIQKHFIKIKLNFAHKSGKNKVDSITDDEILNHYEELDDILGDDLFQSLLNENAEIQIGDVIYKYTDTGVLFANKIHIDEINKFMIDNNIKSLGEISYIKTNQEYPSFNPNGGLKPVTANVNSFIEIKHDKTISETNSAKYLSKETIKSTQDSSLNDQINNLETCNPKSPWLANAFGATKVCTLNYERRRRVKLKYYNVNLFLVYSIGVNIKNQYRGWTGIWREEKTPEIALGVNSVTWFFKNSSVFNNTTNNMVANYYVTDTGKLYTSFNSYNNAQYVGTNKPIPNLPIKNLDIIIEIAADKIGTNLNEYQVRKLFYSQIYGQAKKIMKSLNKPIEEIGVILNQRGQTIVQYYNLGKRCKNCSYIDKKFDWGIVSPKITYNFGTGHGGNFNANYGFNNLTFDFKNPQITGINIYGMVKKNEKWNGFKMVF
ncbi:hypothetical protein B4N84_16445 [Flavobacterium sp. IR1]|nr:hypothetical protein B4N84_16445 [Flavobacterium sp. IR1]